MYRDRLEFELGVIEKMGFASYFLIVWDFVRFAREQGHPLHGPRLGLRGDRGVRARDSATSARSSTTCCSSGSSIRAAPKPPDIDIDFCRDRRELVIDYVKEKYGARERRPDRHVRHAEGEGGDPRRGPGALGPAQAGRRDRQDGPGDAEHQARRTRSRKAPNCKEAVRHRSAGQGGDRLRHRRSKGWPSSAGTHAAGVVIADRPLIEYVPLQKISGKDDILTQWTDVEKAGLLKMDFLGLRNLTILDKAVQERQASIAASTSIPKDLPLDDTETFALLQRGETKGIFQLESGGMRDLLTKMRPDKFDDIIATSALYRPGPLEGGMVMTYVNVKHGRKPPPKSTRSSTTSWPRPTA